MESKIVACGLYQIEEGTKMKRSRSFPVRTSDTKPDRFYQRKINIGVQQQTNLEVCASRLSKYQSRALERE